jgi:hypothetical protein
MNGIVFLLSQLCEECTSPSFDHLSRSVQDRVSESFLAGSDGLSQRDLGPPSAAWVSRAGSADGRRLPLRRIDCSHRLLAAAYPMARSG